jgi:flagellar assembly protein FliH
MMSMSKIIKEHQNGGPDPERPEEASDRFLPLADLWRETGVAGSSLQEQKAQWKRRQEELFDQARQEAERIRKQAREEGYAQGEQEGRLAGQEKYEQAVRRMEAMLATLDREIGARNERYEEELLLLIKATVDRLVHHEVSVNRKVIQACLREALQYVAENSRVKVHLHADDFKRLREAGLEDPFLLEGKNHLQLVADPAVAAGGCFLETDFGEVDASIDTGRQKLYEAIDSIFRNLTDREEPGR